MYPLRASSRASPQGLALEYIEKCNNNSMLAHPFFINKLKKIESLTKSNKLMNITWSNDMIHRITSNQSYPSEYFIKTISNIDIINDKIINPPMIVPLYLINKINYIPLHYNNLLIIDALMHQGSNPIYKNKHTYIFSEHSGVISIKNNIVDSIIVSTDTNRIDHFDNTIFLPHHHDVCYQYEYMFHTHPNTNTYGGRIADNIIYEFPSANDIMYFIQCHNNGKTIGSIIIAPEGIYVIRQIKYTQKISNKILPEQLVKLILKLEVNAIDKYKDIIKELSDPDIFHTNLGNDFSFIDVYNNFLKKYNIMIEYYPREKKNGIWCLRPINLIMMNP